MASVNEYAKWIVENEDKKGTQEFDIVARAFQKAKEKEVRLSSGEAWEEFSAERMAERAFPSLVENVQNLGNAILHPLQTGENVVRLASGAILNIPGAEKLALATGESPESIALDKQKAAQFAEMMTNRYGGVDRALKTLENDPAGFVGDLSALLTGGAALIPKVGKVGRVATSVSKVGAAIDPLNIATNVAQYGGSKVLPKSLPRTLYEKSVKWEPSTPIKERKSITETALKEQLLPTYTGVGRLQVAADQLRANIDNLIEDATNANVKIPAETVFKNIDDVRNSLGGFKVEAIDDVREINRIETKFRNYLKAKKITEVTPKELQEFKVNVTKKVNYGRKSELPSLAKEETYEAMGRGAREALETLDPNISPLNKRLSKLLELKPHLERSAARIENRDIMNLGFPIKAGAGSAIGGIEGAVAGGALSMIDWPAVKARSALDLYKKQNQGLGLFLDNSPQAALTRQLLQQQGRYGLLYPEE